MAGPAKKLRIGDALLEEGMLSQEQLNQALSQQKDSGRMLGQVLAEQGIIPTTALVQVLARCLGIPGVQLRHGLIDPPLIKLIGDEEAERLVVIPMFKV